MKTMMKVGITMGLALACAAVLARGPRGDRMGRDLGLTEQQRAQLQTLRQDHRDQVASLREQLRAKTEAVRKEMAKDAPDLRALDALTDEAATLRAGMQKARLRHLLEVKKVLTAEQWEKARDRFLRGGGPRGEGRGEKGRRGHGGRGPGYGTGECPHGGPPGPPPGEDLPDDF